MKSTTNSATTAGRVLLLGAGPLQLPAIKALKDMQYYVIALDYDPDAVGFAYADEKLLISTLDEQAVLHAAQQLQPDYIFTSTSDAPVRTAAFVNEQLGKLLDITYDNAKCATMKNHMRQRLQDCNVAIPSFFSVSNYEQYLDKVKHFHYRCIVKPADNAGSRGVTLCDSTNYQTAYQFAQQNSRTGIVMVEELMEGPEVSVEALTVHGHTTIITITDKLKTPPPFFVELGHSEPSMLPASTQEQIILEAEKAIKALGIVNGPSHTEIIVTAQGPKVVETAARLGGDYITSRLVPLSTGIDLVAESIKCAVHKETNCTPAFCKGSAIRFVQCTPGTITGIHINEAVYTLDGIQEVTLYVHEGDTATPVHSSNDRIGHVIAQGKNAAEAIEIAEKALSYITFSVIPS